MDEKCWLGNYDPGRGFWGINRPKVIISPPSRWSVESLVAITQRLEKEHYSVALNLLVHEDGSFGLETYKMLKEVAKKLKRGKWNGLSITQSK